MEQIKYHLHLLNKDLLCLITSSYLLKEGSHGVSQFSKVKYKATK